MVPRQSSSRVARTMMRTTTVISVTANNHIINATSEEVKEAVEASRCRGQDQDHRLTDRMWRTLRMQ